jgi:hypothetical protein
MEHGAWHPWLSRNCDLRAVSGEDSWLEGSRPIEFDRMGLLRDHARELSLARLAKS